MNPSKHLKRMIAPVAVLLSLSFGTASMAFSAISEDTPVIVSDDGTECVLMIDLAKVGTPESASQKEIMPYLIELLKSEKMEECEPESVPVLMAILVSELDQYGQPKWSSVSYLAEYKVNTEKLKKIGIDDGTDGELSSVLEKVE